MKNDIKNLLTNQDKKQIIKFFQITGVIIKQCAKRNKRIKPFHGVL